MDEETRKVAEKVEKLMRLAGSNPNEAEAASALAKAQELLAAYNLDMAVIEQISGGSGKRTDEMVAGGMFRYQRELWRHISELNFCFYWTQKVLVKAGSYQAKRGRRWTHEHRLVGRVVNVVGTKNMSGYIEKTIERLCREMLGSDRSMQYYSRDAVAFREGVADRVIEKILERRREMRDEEERKVAEAARKASAQGTSTTTTLTLGKLKESEEAANYDFLYGEGAWAKKEANRIANEKRWAEQRVARAKAQAEAEKAYSEWADANPEEAAKEAAKERAKERAQARRSGGRSRYRFRSTPAEMRRDSGSYHAGYRKGEEVSIEPQMGNPDAARIR